MSREQEERIEKLEEEIQELKEAIQYLAYCKETDEKYAFFDWIVRNSAFNEKRARLDLVLTTLGDRLEGMQPAVTKELAGVSSELLYKEVAPSYDEAKQLLMEALEVKADTIVDELFDALQKQGIHSNLAALKAERGAQP